ncbi:hypothetical protein GE061_002155 [Apolygus lucorum]|uniref:Odorant receptor n=1 Tax=Apolygus lucorum TaxID=248454 RepID=A0A6A4JHA2_APOLU|nr:hypothetical protein GE061_002155 [Apolygus lucorum]
MTDLISDEVVLFIDEATITREVQHKAEERIQMNVSIRGLEQGTTMSKLINLPFANVLWREFKFLSVAGGTYGFYHTKAWAAVTVINYIVMYSALLFTMSVLVYTTYLLRDNIGYLSQALHILIVGCVAMTASSTLTINRFKVEKFIVFFEDPWSLCEYSNNDFFEKLLKETQKKKNRLIVTWILIYGICGMIGLLQSVINTVCGTQSELTNVNGAWLILPFIMWWPEDITASTGAWMRAFLVQGLYVYFCVIMVTASVVFAFTGIERILDQITLIIYGIKTLDRRAKDMFQQKFPGSDVKYMEKEYDDCYYECLVQNVKHHHKMIKWIDAFLDMASLPIAVPFYGGAVLLGMAMITITEKDDPRVGPKCLAASLAFSEAYNMYLLCDVGQRLENLSQELYDTLYFSRWHTRSPKVKKAIQIMKIGCQKPIVFTAAKLLVLNMSLFADLVNSAYSIFNLKSASENLEDK